jgi:DNA helicase TIP49 (TBP-interacting protein)
MDDIVEGKSGGRTVLCSGPLGVGKEANLKDVLIRAQH